MDCRTLGTSQLTTTMIAAVFVGSSAPRTLSAQETSSQPSVQASPEYVGSEACAGCHTKIFETWRSTRHGYSVLSGEEARQAGYPLPEKRRGGAAPTVTSWSDVSYVIGGRQRIAYADRAGRVEDTSYHHRLGRWSPFPPTAMEDCGRCHFTGFGAGDEHPSDAALPGRWVEPNIGCEACHGPGGRHVETYESEDIIVDPSSRSCGECHTAAGRVLPEDDLHDTHDLVQNWNGDPHATGVRFHSHNAFCSRCHSPYEGYFLESRDGTSKRVFAESRRNITCIACHDPHDLTDAGYSREKVSLEPPVTSRRQTYRGNDRDFTTTDFRSLDSTEEVCLECHKGADRIELDHANATCNDCHNTFHRNRGLESRVFHDANHRDLSCRPCHRDADHLLSIVFGDPDFLQPKYIHDLRALPGAVIARYGFRYPGLRGPFGTTKTREPLQPEAPEDPPEVARAGTESGPERRSKAVRALLDGALQQRLAKDDSIRRARMALLSDPDAVTRYLELAREYARQTEFAAARDVLELAASLDSTRLLLDLPFDSAPRDNAEAGSAREQVERILPASRLPEADDLRSWLEGYLDMAAGRFAEAARTFDSAAGRLRKSTDAPFYRGLAELGQGSHEAAVDTLKEVLTEKPTHLCARVALGFAELRRRRFGRAREEFLRAVAIEPGDPVANYLLGQGYLRRRDAPNAIESFRAAVAADPALIDARFALARAYRLGGLAGDAAAAYRGIIALRPGSFDAHARLAALFKELSDRTAWLLRGDVESAPPAGARPREWRQYLADLAQRSEQYARFALSEYALALRIRPHDFESVRQIGEIYRRSGRTDEARRAFEWLARHQGGEWRHPYRLGTLLLEDEQYEEAIAALEKARELSPTQGDTYFALGLAYVRSGRLDEAIDTLRQGIIHEPFNPGLHTNLGATHASRGELPAARKALERALELGTFPLPRPHLTLTNLALVDLREARPTEAKRRLKEALHIFPDYRYARRLLDDLESTQSTASSGGQARLHALEKEPFVFNDLLEVFGEVTTIVLDHE